MNTRIRGVYVNFVKIKMMLAFDCYDCVSKWNKFYYFLLEIPSIRASIDNFTIMRDFSYILLISYTIKI